MDKPKTTPKDFFLWAGAMVALYTSVFSFVSLVFDYINYAFPDPLSYANYGDPYASSISYEMASLFVLFPIFLGLSWLIKKDAMRDPSRQEIWVRRWALYLTLFIAAVTVAIDLITLIMYFLQGELTVRFLLKVLVIFLVAGAGFLHFISDLWGHWERYPQRLRAVAIATEALVIFTIIAGFFIIGTPMQARMYRFDQQKVGDLQTIQYQVVYYWQQKQKLPQNLGELNDPISGFVAPRDPQSGEEYVYQVTGPMAFTLCGNFNQEDFSLRYSMQEPKPYGGPAMIDSWAHSKGTVCFNRTIDPERYPPIQKLQQ